MDTSQHKTDWEELSARLKVSASDAMNQLRSMSVDSSQSMHISRPPASLVSISSSGVCRQITVQRGKYPSRLSSALPCWDSELFQPHGFVHSVTFT